MFLKNRLKRFMAKANAYDSWGGGGNSADDSGRVSGSFGTSGSGTGEDFGSFGSNLSRALAKIDDPVAQAILGLTNPLSKGLLSVGALASAAANTWGSSGPGYTDPTQSGDTFPTGTAESGVTLSQAIEKINSSTDLNATQKNRAIESIRQSGLPLETSIPSVGGVKSNFGDTKAYSYNMNKSPVWEDYVNSNYDKALEEYRNQATKINTATDKQTGVLDTLISGLQSGNNLNPITRQVGDQTYSFIPKPNRETATQISDLLGKRTTGELTSAMGGNANLNYLERLKDLAEMEQKKIAVDKGIDINQQEVEQNEPGLLDYAKGIGSLFSGVSGLFK